MTNGFKGSARLFFIPRNQDRAVHQQTCKVPTPDAPDFQLTSGKTAPAHSFESTQWYVHLQNDFLRNRLSATIATSPKFGAK